MQRPLILAVAVCAAFALGAFGASWYASRSVAELHDPASGGIGIPALIEQVRNELIASDLQRTATGAPALFVANSVDLEVSFVVKQDQELGSKVALQVVEANHKVMLGTERTHKMTIHLDVQQPQNFTVPPNDD